MQAHEFALYFPQLSKLHEMSNLHPSSTLTIKEPELVRRITHIVRLKPQERCILFDAQYHIQVIIEAVGKELHCKITEFAQNKALQPAITTLLPLLKREALTDAI